MFDPVQTQYDLMGLLLSDERLLSINTKSYRKMRIQQEVDLATIYQTRRNGRTGCGVLVAFPVADNRNPNVTGPQLNWTFPVVCIEQPDINMHPTLGTLITAEQLAQYVMDIFHMYADDKVGTFECKGNSMEPEKEFAFQGTVGYRCNLNILGKDKQTARTAVVTLVRSVDVAGAGNSNVTDGTYTQFSTINGRDAYGTAGVSAGGQFLIQGDGAYIYWTGTLWAIGTVTASIPFNIYTSANDVTTPNNATFTSGIPGNAPAPTVTNLMVALASTNANEIMYTLDGTFPGRQVAGNASSHLYSAPLALSSGDILRAIAYADGKINSAARYYEVQ